MFFDKKIMMFYSLKFIINYFIFNNLCGNPASLILTEEVEKVRAPQAGLSDYIEIS